MADIKETLSKQIGPFPLGVWIIIVGAGLGIGYVFRRGIGSGSNTDLGDAGDPGTTTAGGTMTGTPGSASSSSQPTTGPTTNSLGQPILGTNDEWLQWASTQLIGRGFLAGPTYDALSAYLQGKSLTAAQQAIVDSAMQYGGVPPQLVYSPPRTPVTTVQPNDPETPATTPATVVTPTPTPQASASIAVPQAPSLLAQIAQALAPNTVVQVQNPVPGDTSAVAVAKLPDGNTMTYGGTQAQVDLLKQAAAAPAPAPAPQTVITDGVGRRYQDANGFWFTAG